MQKQKYGLGISETTAEQRVLRISKRSPGMLTSSWKNIQG